jgi:2-aminoadipate transaminase
MKLNDSATHGSATALLPHWADALVSRRSSAVASSAIRDLLAITRRPEIISLAGGLPDVSAMPHEWLRELLADALGTPGALQYSATEGDPELRAVLAGWESTWVGRPITDDDVLVTTGSQQALDLLGKALLDPGDVVIVEDPAYVGALQAFHLAGATLLAVPQDGNGLRTDLLEAQLAGGVRPKLVYLTPTFHNPAGTSLSPIRRAHVAALAERYGFLIVEDDAYRLLPFGADAPQPIAAHTDRVVRLGTFSKILSPGLRVGWLTAPGPIMAALVRVKQATDLHTSTLAQVVLGRAAADTHRLEAHLAPVRALYAARAAHLVGALRGRFGERLALTEPAGGMFCWATFADGTSVADLLPRALAAGVAFVPGPAFSPSGGTNASALRLCFASVNEQRLTQAVERLHSAVDG